MIIFHLYFNHILYAKFLFHYNFLYKDFIINTIYIVSYKIERGFFYRFQYLKIKIKILNNHDKPNNNCRPN